MNERKKFCLRLGLLKGYAVSMKRDEGVSPASRVKRGEISSVKVEGKQYIH